MNYELDLTVHEDSWVLDHPIYCPIPWCSANKLRTARCGDKDGEYEGIHVARIAYIAQSARSDRRRIAFYRKLGVSNPELAAGMARALQDSIDLGMMKGRRGRRV